MPNTFIFMEKLTGARLLRVHVAFQPNQMSHSHLTCIISVGVGVFSSATDDRQFIHKITQHTDPGSELAKQLKYRLYSVEVYFTLFGYSRQSSMECTTQNNAVQLCHVTITNFTQFIGMNEPSERVCCLLSNVIALHEHTMKADVVCSLKTLEN